MIGGTLLQTLILLWVTFRTDWKKEVSDLMKVYCYKLQNLLDIYRSMLARIPDKEGGIYFLSKQNECKYDNSCRKTTKN